MKLLRALIVEDESQNIDILKHFLVKYCPQVEIVGVATSVEDAVVQINNYSPNLLLLDIMLGNSTGFDLLDLVSQKNIDVIFITAYNQFAIKAFQYSALDYLTKPLDIDQLTRAISKAESKINTEELALKYSVLKNQYVDRNSDVGQIAIQMHDKLEVIKLSSIVYVSADGKYSTFILDSGNRVVSSKNIGEYEKLLPPDIFYRVHHSYIVNLSQVNHVDKKIDTQCTMSNGDSVPISRRKKVGFVNSL